jgi:hypothetical protein
MRRKTKSGSGKWNHTTCRVSFEDTRGDLHHVVVRVPRGARAGVRTLTRLASHKVHQAVVLIDRTCSTSGAVPLPHLPRRK